MLFTNTGSVAICHRSPRPAHWYLPSGHLRTFSPSFIDRMFREAPGPAQGAQHRVGSKSGDWIHADHTQAFLKGRKEGGTLLRSSEFRGGEEWIPESELEQQRVSWPDLPQCCTLDNIVPRSPCCSGEELQITVLRFRLPEPLSCHLPFENKLGC